MDHKLPAVRVVNNNLMPKCFKFCEMSWISALTNLYGKCLQHKRASGHKLLDPTSLQRVVALKLWRSASSLYSAISHAPIICDLVTFQWNFLNFKTTRNCFSYNKLPMLLKRSKCQPAQAAAFHLYVRLDSD